MNARRVVTAFLLALMLSGLFTLWLSKRLAKAAPSAAMPMLQVVVAARDLQAGETLSTASLTTIGWPATQPLPGAVGNPQELVGRVLVLPVSSGEPLLSHHLIASSAGSGLAARIPKGMRAISVRADEAAEVAGFVQPGNSVDVLVTFHPESGSGFQSVTVLQKVRVLAIDQRSEPDAQAKPSASGTVTLLVTPEDAANLMRANSFGKITFTLRNEADGVLTQSGQESLFMPAIARSPAAASAARVFTNRASPSPKRETAGFTVETIAGNKQTTQTFEGNQP